MSTFNPYGQPPGYDQFAPGRDIPNASRQPRSSPLRSAILNDQADDNPAAAPEAPQAPQQPGATSYPPDRTMTAFVNRPPGPQPPLVRVQSSGISQVPPEVAAGGAPTSSSGHVPPPAGGTYAPIGGFATEKIQNQDHVNDKYSNDLRWFSQALAATGAQPGDQGLQQVVNWINQNGGQASADRDMLTINGGSPVDTLVDYNPGKTDYGTGWAYQNNQQAAAAPQPAGLDPLTLAILQLTQQNPNVSYSDSVLQSLLPRY